MVEQVQVGVIGTSAYADYFIPWLKSHPKAALAAICGRNRDRVGEMSLKYSIPAVFTDYHDMINNGKLDAVIVAAPDDLHYPMVMAALDAGLHVLCEKPMALNVRQAREMYEKAQAVGVKHMVFFTWQWLPHYQYLGHLIASGYIGRCFDCHITYNGGHARSGNYGWRFDRKRANGALGDLGAHAIDFARRFVGDIARVNAHLATVISRPGVDSQVLDAANDSATLTLEFTNGAHGTITVSSVVYMAERDQEQYIILHGESGTLEAELTFPAGRTLPGEIRGARQDDDHFHILPVPADYWDNADRTQLLDVFSKRSIGSRLFIDSIVEDCPVTPNFYDGLKVQEVIDAALESDRTGCWAAIAS